MTRAPTDAAFEMFRTALKRHGVRDSLAYLVGLTDYRFIGIWRFKDGKANAAVHYDRLNPDVMHAQEVPDNATYCCYVRDSRGVFTTAHAMLDPRTVGHPARETVSRTAASRSWTRRCTSWAPCVTTILDRATPSRLTSSSSSAPPAR